MEAAFSQVSFWSGGSERPEAGLAAGGMRSSRRVGLRISPPREPLGSQGHATQG